MRDPPRLDSKDVLHMKPGDRESGDHLQNAVSQDWPQAWRHIWCVLSIAGTAVNESRVKTAMVKLHSWLMCWLPWELPNVASRGMQKRNSAAIFPLIILPTAAQACFPASGRAAF